MNIGDLKRNRRKIDQMGILGIRGKISMGEGREGKGRIVMYNSIIVYV
jgi:hypothetical protein